MNPTRPALASWPRAASFAERLALVSHSRGLDLEPALADDYRRRWNSQFPDAGAAPFADRLQQDQVTPETLDAMLSLPLVTVERHAQAAPDWIEQWAEALGSADAIARPDESTSEEEQVSGFLNLARPLLDRAATRLHRAIHELGDRHPIVPFDHGIVAELIHSSLPEQLLMMLSRTVVLELNVARLQGRLDGSEPGQRYRSFVSHLRDRESVSALLEEYPVLARQLALRTEQWTRFALEFLEHLCVDWNDLATTFGMEISTDPDRTDRLVALDGGLGDSHRQGRSVMVARFRSGLKLVYKPKSLSLDVHFQALLTWLNARGGHPPFRTIAILDRGTHGWVEFVEARPCPSRETVERFYERQGGFIALLYALEATDFHFENLIAAGEHPVLIDLETFFQPHIARVGDADAEDLSRTEIDHSVLRAGLLPQRIWADEESEGIDLSGLGANAGQLTPFEVPDWDGTGTDQMRFTRRRLEVAGGENQPALDGVAVAASAHVDAIVSGFSDMYRLLTEHREELLSASGPLARFNDDEVRAVLRPTMSYGKLLSESYHPDLLRDALDRELLFERLWDGVDERPHLVRVVGAERDDLRRGDVPIFTTRPGTRCLWTSTGERIPGFFAESGMALVEQRLRGLDSADLRKQVWFIRASLTTLSSANGAARRGSRGSGVGSGRPGGDTSRERLLAGACAVGDQLEALALRGERDVSWIGLSPVDARYCALQPLGVDLYDGLPGIALFLAYLGHVTGKARYTRLAETALATIRRHLASRGGEMDTVGAFKGWGGILYTLAHLGSLWEDGDMLSEAHAHAKALDSLIERDRQLDIIGGSAGCIGGLLALHRAAPSASILARARQCGERLLATKQAMASGLGWTTNQARNAPLAGFSHGAAGMAWALQSVARETGEERFSAAAARAIAYERSLFDPATGDWRDLRFETGPDTGHDHHMTAWCNGAPGIGLARLASRRGALDAQTLSEVEAAVAATVAHGFGANHSLCHGDLGNLELLVEANRALNRPALRARQEELTVQILDSIEREGWSCGLPLAVETPGLMTGLAGIGYGLLRLAAHEHVPSVLMLAPPRGAV